MENRTFPLEQAVPMTALRGSLLPHRLDCERRLLLHYNAAHLCVCVCVCGVCELKYHGCCELTI